MGRAAVAAGIALCIASALVLAVVVVPDAGHDGPDEAPASGTLGESGAADSYEGIAREFDQTRFIITVHDDGSARWTFQFRQFLDNETEQRRFREFADRFEATETDLYTNFRDNAEQLTASGADTTGRSMAAENFSRSATVTTGVNTIGVVEISFTWAGFAREDGDRYVVGDVFEGGLFIDRSQSLIFKPGPNLELQSIEPEDGTYSNGSARTSDSVTWQGSKEFTDQHPRVVFVPPGYAPPGQAGGGGVPWLMVGGALVVIAGIASVVVYQRRSIDRSPRPGTVERPTATPQPVDSEPAVPDEELLSDEDRVLQLLDENGGRMRQVNIVDETGWSKSKVSMLLSDMEDEGDITKLRVGRENIISLEGEEPEVAGSPFEEEADD